GHVPIGVGFAARPNDPRYDNKRTEMYFELVQWIKNGGALPDIPELVAALSQTTYSFRGDRLLLEPKEQVKARLGYSPDDADALALTFAQPVAARQVFTDGAGYTYTLQDREPRYSGPVRRFCITNDDPLEDASCRGRTTLRAARTVLVHSAFPRTAIILGAARNPADRGVETALRAAPRPSLPTS